MSQIKFLATYNGKPAEVMAGWDPPLGYYHLTIFDADPNAEEELLWDGLGNMGFCRSLNKIKTTLESLNIEAPPSLLDLIDRREGNVVYRWIGDKWERTSSW